ncbi:MAG: phosphoadenylyl-sulfate reductase [Alphaproteobacteria bacterium]|nr:MAG: phosphoadenylyl-sulfate reductase [Alphaproteobacteria bacterium]
MTLLLSIDANGARISGGAEARPAPVRPVLANDGHGDVRKKIVPIVRPPAGPSQVEWEGGAWLSLQQWLDAPQAGAGVLLQPVDDTHALTDRLDGVAIIAVDFPRIGDGRGYSHAFLLRQRLGYKGPLRAVGAVTADQVFALEQVGFDSFALRADQAAEPAVAALNSYAVPYLTAFRDRDAAVFDAKVRLLEKALTAIAQRHERPALATSLSAEDMVLTDVIARLKLPIDVFTLDTGRLHAETLALIGETEQRYGLTIARQQPAPSDVAAYVAAHGVDGFYEGLAERKLCCGVRKVLPLDRALEGRDAWLTGQRREQATTRAALAESERDAERNMQKYNPLADWSWADVLAYAARFSIPMSPLYARGYVSIGCEPCTKAIRPGEDPRAGRWWWESQDSKECGLHTNPTTTRQ